MQQDWFTFLTQQHANINQDNTICFPVMIQDSKFQIIPLTHLGVLAVSGQDAATLLQGQLTCNINDIGAHQGILGAMCNAKGRAIATLLLIKKDNDFLLILPLSLAEVIRAKLQMYVLRAKVKIQNRSEELCLLGLTEEAKSTKPRFATEYKDDSVLVQFDSYGTRSLVVAETGRAIEIWRHYAETKAYAKVDTSVWQLADMVDGIPWLDELSSEQYIPQMLNIDKLGGISFTKGCYTGQEVVARTHYLGKVKRELRLAECDFAAIPAANSAVLNREGQVVGHVLNAQADRDKTKLLLIMQMTDIDHNGLKLNDYNQTNLHFLPLLHD